MKTTELSLLNANTLELHYWFKDDSHLMDAFIQNKCEYEVLAIMKELSSVFNVEITVETQPFGEGGLLRWFKIDSKDKSIAISIKIAIITALLTTIFITPISTSIEKATEHLIEKIFEDKELKELEKEELKLKIEKLRQEVGYKSQLLNENNLIKKRRSNFYEALEKYPKLDRVSLHIEDENRMSLDEEVVIVKKDFKDYILVSDDLDPKEVDEAIIEIISPVLKKGKYKWTGIYNGEPIAFDMKSNEFKTLVQTSKIEFKNGSSINCALIVKRKIDNEGFERTVGYEVLRVNDYFENDKPIETSEGRFHRQKKEAEKRQYRISFED
jgi:hypothetical protein